MKVLNLQCAHGHGFEGWFGSEVDFVSQCERKLVQCPVCSSAEVVKLPSAPRLNLTVARQAAPVAPENQTVEAAVGPDVGALWLEVAKQVLANTTDVGAQFAEEARRIHYGEAEERSIRGKTSAKEAMELLEEGIAVVPFALPESMKKPLQ